MKLFLYEMGLFTLHNGYVSRLLNFLKLKRDSQSRLTIPEFSGYHCTYLLPTAGSNPKSDKTNVCW